MRRLFGNAIPTERGRKPDPRNEERRRAVPPLPPAAQARAAVAGLLRLRCVRAARRLRREVPLRGRARLDRRSRRAARRGVSGARAAGLRRALDRRLREPGQAQRRVFGAGLRRQSVHADELQRHARCGVHAGPRARPLDAHDAVARDAAVRLCRATRSSWRRCRRR